jgi:hypothetical protein
MSHYEGLTDEQMMELANALNDRQRCREVHDYITMVRDLIDGRDKVNIPESHRALQVGENHEGGHRLNVRIRQGSAWLSDADVRFRVTGGDTEKKLEAEKMEKFARFGERRLSRGRALHKWRQEANRDLFEAGVSVVQHNPRREYYQAVKNDPDRLTKAAPIGEIFWRRRVDPLYWFWDEDDEGDVGSSMIAGSRELGEIVRVSDKDRLEAVKGHFPWGESLSDRGFPGGKTVQVRELWTPDRGVLIVMDRARRGALKPDDPKRIIATWENPLPRVPFYVATAGGWPWVSPLDEMIQLTPERNYWATMLDLQAAGAIFRHWQLRDTNTGEAIERSLWAVPDLPENILLDMSKPPPNMGPGTEWVLAPFEYHDVLPRHTQIVQQHEAAGQSVARLMGQAINEYTAVGTADMIEDYARKEFAEMLLSEADRTALMWEDSFRYIRTKHPKGSKIAVAGRLRSVPITDDDGGDYAFFNTHLEIDADCIVAEDVAAVIDTRSRMSLIADWRLGREMQTAGDIDFDRRVEQGLVPWVDDASETKAAIFIDQMENISLEQQIISHAKQVREGLEGTPPPEEFQLPLPNITRGSRPDPRSSGTGRGPNNASDTALAAGATDTVRSA